MIDRGTQNRTELGLEVVRGLVSNNMDILADPNRRANGAVVSLALCSPVDDGRYTGRITGRLLSSCDSTNRLMLDLLYDHVGIDEVDTLEREEGATYHQETVLFSPGGDRFREIYHRTRGRETFEVIADRVAAT